MSNWPNLPKDIKNKKLPFIKDYKFKTEPECFLVQNWTKIDYNGIKSWQRKSKQILYKDSEYAWVEYWSVEEGYSNMCKTKYNSND